MRFILIMSVFAQGAVMGVLKDRGCHLHGAHKYPQRLVQEQYICPTTNPMVRNKRVPTETFEKNNQVMIAAIKFGFLTGFIVRHYSVRE